MNKRNLTIAGGTAATAALLLTGGLLIFGGSDDGDTATTTTVAAATTVTTSTPATSTTLAETTTTTGPTTTTMGDRPVFDIQVTMETEGRPSAMVEELYAWLGDTSNPMPEMVQGLQDYLESRAPSGDFSGTGASNGASLGTEEEGISRIAVATVGEGDVVLSVNDGDEWRIVGAKLESVGYDTWYGEPVRQVFIIGSDARPGQSQPVFRGDSLHILSSNVAEHAGAITGFPRDTYVQAPYGPDKFTHVNALAGPDASAQVAAEVSGLPIEGYIVTGFYGFEHLVNDFGGVSVNVPFSMAEPKSKAYLNAGEQVLYGANALAFSRNRTINGGDFTRSFHQGIVIHGALDAVLATDISRLPLLLKMLDNRTWTNLTAEELLTLAAGAWEMDPAAVTNLVLQGTVTTRNGASVVDLNQDEAAAIFEDLVDGYLDQSDE
ncbi:LCP family protein [bacterium]|nr:LCP family protein [bacterium]